MRIAVFGTGGAAGYFGARLAQSDEDVTFIARGKHLEAIRKNGLRVESVKGDLIIQPAQATDDPAQVGIVDVVLLGVKAWQVTEAANAMRPMVGETTCVLPIQNGVEASSELAAVLGTQHVLGGMVRIFSFISGAGQIRHIGGPASITFGELDNRRTERVERLCAATGRAGIVTEVAADINAELWKKFMLVNAIGGVGTITRAPIGVVRTLRETRAMLEEAMCEAQEVAQARGISLPSQIVEKTMAFVDNQEPSATSSMQRDIREGKPSELEYWNGAVVRLGRQAGIHTPLNSFIYWSLLPMELRARGQLAFPVE